MLKITELDSSLLENPNFPPYSMIRSAKRFLLREYGDNLIHTDIDELVQSLKTHPFHSQFHNEVLKKVVLCVLECIKQEPLIDLHKLTPEISDIKRKVTEKLLTNSL